MFLTHWTPFTTRNIQLPVDQELSVEAFLERVALSLVPAKTPGFGLQQPDTRLCKAQIIEIKEGEKVLYR